MASQTVGNTNMNGSATINIRMWALSTVLFQLLVTKLDLAGAFGVFDGECMTLGDLGDPN